MLAVAVCHRCVMLSVYGESDFSRLRAGVSCSSLHLFTDSEERQEYLKGRKAINQYVWALSTE